MAVLAPVEHKGIEIVAVEIEHWKKGIHYTVAQPSLRILIDCIVGIPSKRAVTCEIVVLAKRCTAHAHPWFKLLDRRIDTRGNACNVGAAPCRKRHALAVPYKERTVGVAVNAVWVTHIVEVNAVDIIVLHNLLYKRRNIIGRCGVTGLHVPGALVTGTEVALSVWQRVPAQASDMLVLAERQGYKPCMQPDAALVALLDGKSQGVVPRRLAAHAGEHMREGFNG